MFFYRHAFTQALLLLLMLGSQSTKMPNTAVQTIKTEVNKLAIKQ